MDTDEQHSPEITQEGIEIVQQLLAAWGGSGTSEDVDMDKGDSSTEAQLEELKKVVEKFRPQIEANPWLQSMIANL